MSNDAIFQNTFLAQILFSTLPNVLSKSLILVSSKFIFPYLLISNEKYSNMLSNKTFSTLPTLFLEKG